MSRPKSVEDVLHRHTKGSKQIIPIKIREVARNVFQLSASRPSCHVYLIKSKIKNVLIDTGIDFNFPELEKALKKLGLSISDVHIIINTHEHFDHIGANRYFFEHSMISASRSAATKIGLQDKYVTLYEEFEHDAYCWKPHLWLENRSAFELGDFHLRIIDTPGHTSGCICVYEPFLRLLFSGDTVFAHGTLSLIAPSGSAADYVNSIERLSTRKIDLILPSHGKITDTPEEDFKNARKNAIKKLKEARARGGTDTWTESTWDNLE